MKRIISILLVFLIIFPFTVFARADKYTTYTGESRLYHVVNEDKFVEIFGAKPDELTAYHELKSDVDLDSRFINNLSERKNIDQISDVIYTFDIDGKGSYPSVTTTQYATVRSINFLSEYNVIYTGSTKETAIINGRELTIYMLINYSPDKRAMSVNISACEADDPDNFTHFTIGEPFLSQDMIGAWTKYDHSNARGLYNPDDTYSFIESTDAIFEGESLNDNISHNLEITYNPARNLLKTKVTTNARAIDEHFSKTGVSQTKVAEISITVEADERMFPRIGNLHYFYDEIGGKEVSFGENKFRWYYLFPMFYDDLFDYWEEEANHRHIVEDGDLVRTDTLILHKSDSVEYDNEPFELEYRLESPFLTTGRFKVSSHVVYRTFYTPYGTDKVVCYVTDGGVAETEWVELDVR
ncbi:MAG: hypothetical protein IKM61_04920 [Eubacteriaceae bacterium]|nr:hypothetical protein [Eubacteriaceae bacterium]